MKYVLKVVLINTFTLSSAQALATKAPFVVYGTDDRHEVYQASALHKKWARSTAVLLDKKDITLDPAGSGLIQLNQSPLNDYLKKYMGAKACSGTRYAEQANPGQCSGFLIAPDLIVTAGHCIELDNFCQDYKWVFDFELDPVTKKAGLNIKPENVYNCKKVVSYKLDGREEIDYGVVQLDRKVPGREPLTLNAGKKISDSQELVVIGNPSGLPTKVAPGAAVRSNDNEQYFVANLDTFSGNSGSAVFNAATGVVEGILVRGEDDYLLDPELMCMEVNTCGSDECRGEDVSRMTSIPEVRHQKAFNAAAVSGDVKTLETLAVDDYWVDFYGKDGKTALMLAAEANQTQSIKTLLALKADVNVTDSAEETVLHVLARNGSKTSEEALKLILKAGAKLEARNLSGETPLLIAGKALNLEAAKLLIKNGANAEAIDRNGETVLFGFARANNLDALIALNKLGVDLKPVKSIVGKNIRWKRFIQKLFKQNLSAKK